MRYLSTISALAFLAATPACAQTANNLAVLQGLAPFSALLNTDAGKAALDGNYKVTGAIQTGTAKQPGLEPFAAQQARALRDAYITLGNGTELADGLGSTLGDAYQKATPVTMGKDKDGKPKPVFTNISPNIGNLLLYSVVSAGLDANAGKFFFANGTYQPGKAAPQPASADALAFMTAVGGKTDVMGKAYHLPAGSNGADPEGDSRPFQTEKNFLSYADPDYFGIPSSNTEWLDGAVPGTKSMGMKLLTSPSFPSGHTTYGYTEGVLLAILVPARYTQQITRAAEYGNNRIVLGAHYAMDVLGGRTVALYDLAQLLSENPAYLNQKLPKTQPIGNYAEALKLAQADLTADLTKALEASTGTTIADAAAKDTSRFANADANEAFYESTQTYGLPVVYPAQTAPEDVAKIAPEAGTLLTAAFPYLTLKQADDILTATEGPGGGFLDNGSHFGLYSRLDLYKAGLQAEALAPK